MYSTGSKNWMNNRTGKLFNDLYWNLLRSHITSPTLHEQTKTYLHMPLVGVFVIYYDYMWKCQHLQNWCRPPNLNEEAVTRLWRHTKTNFLGEAGTNCDGVLIDPDTRKCTVAKTYSIGDMAWHLLMSGFKSAWGLSAAQKWYC